MSKHIKFRSFTLIAGENIPTVRAKLKTGPASTSSSSTSATVKPTARGAAAANASTRDQVRPTINLVYVPYDGNSSTGTEEDIPTSAGRGATRGPLQGAQRQERRPGERFPATTTTLDRRPGAPPTPDTVDVIVRMPAKGRAVYRTKPGFW